MSRRLLLALLIAASFVLAAPTRPMRYLIVPPPAGGCTLPATLPCTLGS